MKIEVCLAGKENALVIADLSRQTFLDTFAFQNSKENMDIFMNKHYENKDQNMLYFFC